MPPTTWVPAFCGATIDYKPVLLGAIHKAKTGGTVKRLLAVDEHDRPVTAANLEWVVGSERD